VRFVPLFNGVEFLSLTSFFGFLEVFELPIGSVLFLAVLKRTLLHFVLPQHETIIGRMRLDLDDTLEIHRLKYLEQFCGAVSHI